jgi:hypothetical protein
MTETIHNSQDLTRYEANELKELQQNPDYLLSSQMTNRFASLGYIGFNGEVPFVTELGKIALEIG